MLLPSRARVVPAAAPAPAPTLPSPASGRALGLVRERVAGRSEEHTSELQSQSNLVCRLLLEKKKTLVLIAFVSVKLTGPGLLTTLHDTDPVVQALKPSSKTVPLIHRLFIVYFAIWSYPAVTTSTACVGK